MTRRKPFGKALPPVTEFPAPTEQELNVISATWDRLVPQWAGLLDAKPLGWEGTPAPRFFRDEIKQQTIRARDGHIVTNKERRAAMEIYLDGLRK